MKSNRQQNIRYHFNEYGGIVVLYWRGKWHSVGEKRVHSPKEILISLTTAHTPKLITVQCRNARHCDEIKQQDMEQELIKNKDEKGHTWYLDEESGKEYYYRIRKLTPRECFRLMGVRDKDIDTIQAAGISNSQQYKMAGNSIVVDQLVYLFMQMFSPDRKVGKPMPRQLSLF